jgi:hypothetical protein
MSDDPARRGRTERTVRSNRRSTTANSLPNALDFAIDRKLAAARTSFIGVQGGGSVTPAVCETDNFGNAVPAPAISGTKTCAIQAGAAGIVLPIQPGDKSLMLCTDVDSSGVTPEGGGGVTPGSFRTRSLSDAVSVLAVDMPPPTDAVITFDPPGGRLDFYTLNDMAVKSDGNLTVEVRGDLVLDVKGNVTLKAGGSITLEAAGGVSVKGAGITAEGGLTNRGGLANSGGTLSSNGVVLDTHTHPTSEGDTGGPK